MDIRVAVPADASAIAAIYRPIVERTCISFELEPPSDDAMRARIVQTLATLPWLVAEDDTGAVAGYAYAGKHRERPAYSWSVDVSAYVRDDCRRNGVGRRLYAALYDTLKSLGYCQAFAGIALPNPASVALHEAMGFVLVGIYRNVGFKHGGWHDVGWWQKELAAPQTPMQPSSFADRGSVDSYK